MSRQLVKNFNLEVAGATSIENLREISLKYINEEINLISSEVKAEFGNDSASSELIDKINSEISSALKEALEMVISGYTLCPDWVKVGCYIAAHKTVVRSGSFDDPLSYERKDAIEKSILSKLERDGVYEV